MKKLSLLALIISLVFIISACGTNLISEKAATFYADDNGFAYDAASPVSYGEESRAAASEAYVEPALEAPSEGTGGGFGGGSSKMTEKPSYERKIIKNGDFSIETLEYDKSVSALEALVESFGGYIQNSTISGAPAIDRGYYNDRYASYTVRIPASGLDSFEEALSECGSVTSKHIYVNEVTDYYYDTAAHISSLQTEEAQLLELLKSAKEREGIIALHTRLSEVRYEIESLQGVLRRLDDQVSFSTVNIYLQEVSEPTRIREVPQTLGERISDRFSETWAVLVSFFKDVIVFFAGNIIVIALWAVVIAVIVLLIKKAVRKAKGLPENKKAASNAVKADEKTDDLTKE